MCLCSRPSYDTFVAADHRAGRELFSLVRLTHCLWFPKTSAEKNAVEWWIASSSSYINTSVPLTHEWKQSSCVTLCCHFMMLDKNGSLFFFFFPLLCSEYGYTALLIAPLHWLVLVLSVLLYKIPLFFVCYWTFKVLMDTNIILILLLFVKDFFANHKIVYRHHIYFIKIVWNFSEVYFSCSPDKLLMLKTKLNLVWLCVWCMMFLI